MSTRLRACVAVIAATVASAACAGTAPADLREGDCVNVSGAAEAASVTRVDCAEPHDAQVFFVASLADAPEAFDAAAVQQVAEDECLFMFWDFVGVHYYQSDLEARWLVPGESAWASGEQRAVCLVQSPDGQVTGTLRGR